jgi:hypothetical protein
VRTLAPTTFGDQGRLQTVRIIGVEIKFVDEQEQRQEELALLPANIIIPNFRMVFGRYRIPITVHTTIGDMNLRGDFQ